ncbi:hypothetical protein RHSIM_Rhsim12G0010100 [Rhododendron simsii]|uniref:Uncharacterized protein n=1 Tax=Rhododendron simsii TaxID=118357 RepID=A0A834G5C3_RHOSS|nr:hypothetical protein RHSIM_Rhsim12G0010100 [Rhododendron simsii]
MGRSQPLWLSATPHPPDSNASLPFSETLLSQRSCKNSLSQIGDFIISLPPARHHRASSLVSHLRQKLLNDAGEMSDRDLCIY